MVQAVVSAYVSLEAYFERETTLNAESPKHEWCDGVVYSMSRGSIEHGRLVARLIWALRNAVDASCEVYASDTMLFIDAASLSTYADATLVCGPPEIFTVRKNGKSLGQAITNSKVVLEVLSESTERYDRDGKFQAYKRLASLEDYVLVSQESRRVEVFRRVNGFRGEVATATESILIGDARVRVDDIYGAPESVVDG